MKRPPQMTAAQAQRQAQRRMYYLAQSRAQTAVQWAQAQNTATAGAWTAMTASNTVVTAITGGTPTGSAWPATSVIVSSPHWTDDYNPTPHNNILTIPDGARRTVFLPDGTAIEVAADGSFTINDKDAKVTYRANRVREFNSYLNASDKLEAFIKFCGKLGVRQEEMLNIPVKHFIAWLIIEAARADGEEPDIDLLEGIHDHVRPRCAGCGRFLARKLAARKITFCRPACLEKQLAIAA